MYHVSISCTCYYLTTTLWFSEFPTVRIQLKKPLCTQKNENILGLLLINFSPSEPHSISWPLFFFLLLFLKFLKGPLLISFIQPVIQKIIYRNRITNLMLYPKGLQFTIERKRIDKIYRRIVEVVPSSWDYLNNNHRDTDFNSLIDNSTPLTIWLFFSPQILKLSKEGSISHVHAAMFSEPTFSPEEHFTHLKHHLGHWPLDSKLREGKRSTARSPLHN